MAEKTRRVEVVPYQPEWKTEFNRLRGMLEGCLGDLVLTIEHVGSTSVEGLWAKPIIDVDVVMESYAVLPAIIDRLAEAGYEHQGNLGVEGREAFRPVEENGFPKHHLYVCPQDGRGYLEHIALRNYLRTNEEARQAYQALKLRLAVNHRYDVDQYCENKTAFIQTILDKTLYRKP